MVCRVEVNAADGNNQINKNNGLGFLVALNCMIFQKLIELPLPLLILEKGFRSSCLQAKTAKLLLPLGQLRFSASFRLLISPRSLM